MVAKVSLSERGEKPVTLGSWKSGHRHEVGPCREGWKPLPRPQPREVMVWGSPRKCQNH